MRFSARVRSNLLAPGYKEAKLVIQMLSLHQLSPSLTRFRESGFLRVLQRSSQILSPKKDRFDQYSLKSFWFYEFCSELGFRNMANIY